MEENLEHDCDKIGIPEQIAPIKVEFPRYKNWLGAREIISNIQFHFVDLTPNLDVVKNDPKKEEEEVKEEVVEQFDYYETMFTAE